MTAHCDAPTFLDLKGDRQLLSHATLQLYLNDADSLYNPTERLVGGATSFLSENGKRCVDFHPTAGSVLIF